MKKLILLLIYTLYAMPILFSQQMNIVRQQCLGTDENDYPGCIAETNNGFLTSTTIIDSFPGISNYHGSADAWLVELDTIGNIIWEKCFGGSDGESIMKIIELPNNEYYLFGGTNSSNGDVQSFNHDSYDIWVVKIDKQLEIIWEKCYGTYSHDSPRDAIETPDGGLLILGSITTTGGDISSHYGSVDGWLCRIDSLGNILWEKSYGNHNSDEIWKILPTSQNTYMLVGSFYESGGMIECQKDSSDMQRDAWLIEVDTLGEILRQFCYGGSYWEQAWDIVEVVDGYVILSNTNSNDMDVSGLHDGSYPGGIPNPDIWVFKIDYDGNMLWQTCLGGTKIETSLQIFENEDNGFMVFGYTGSIDGDVVGNHNPYGDNSDVWVVKINEIGELQWQQCFGSFGWEFITRNSVAKMNDYNYTITCETSTLGGDVECLINPQGEYRKDAWVFQIKDCNHYAPQQPQQPTGKDTLCVNTDSITNYSTSPATNAWYYEWELQPNEAGNTINDSIATTIHWNSNYEGPATLKVRSTNDCGESEWSDSVVIQTYMCLGTYEPYTHGDLRVYPNPATNTLIIDIESFNTIQKPKIEIYNSIGNKVLSTVANSNINSVIVNDWPSGIYIVKVSNGIDNYSRKVIVN